MKKEFISAALVLMLSGCVETTSQNQFGSNVLKKGLPGGYRPNETLEIYDASGTMLRRGRLEATGDYYHYSTKRFDIEINPVEVPWSTENALQAKRPNWVAGCSSDRMTDRTTCRINILPQGPGSSFGGLYQTVDRQGNILSSCVIGHDFPGRRGMIRVDGNQAITTDTEGCIYGATARNLQGQLTSGKRLQTRRVEWPYDYHRDKEMLIAGGYRSARSVYQFSASADLASLFNITTQR